MAQRLISGALWALGSIMAIVLLAIMMLNVVDVIGRYFLNRPIPGVSEIIEFALAILVFGTLPLATIAREHIVIDLLDFAMTRRAKHIQQIMVHFTSALLLAFVAWRLWVRAAEIGAHGDVTQSLRLPLAPLGYAMSIMAWTSVTALAVLFVGAFRVDLDSPRNPEVAP